MLRVMGDALTKFTLLPYLLQFVSLRYLGKLGGTLSAAWFSRPPASAWTVEVREDLRLDFVQYLAVFLRPRCSGRSGRFPVSKRCQSLAIVFADLPERRVANAPPTYFQLAQREPTHDGGDI